MRSAIRSCRAVGRAGARPCSEVSAVLPFAFAGCLAEPFALPLMPDPLACIECKGLLAPCGLIIVVRRTVLAALPRFGDAAAGRSLARLWAARTSAFTSS